MEDGAEVAFTRVLSIYHLHAVYLTTAIQKTISLSERREILTTAICQHDRAFISEPEPAREPLNHCLHDVIKNVSHVNFSYRIITQLNSFLLI